MSKASEFARAAETFARARPRALHLGSAIFSVSEGGGIHIRIGSEYCVGSPTDAPTIIAWLKENFEE
jgi:diaminopimelate decarboxylase